MHCNRINDALNLDLPRFCFDLVAAARAWLDAVEGTQPYETNAAAGVRRHPNGLAPYIVGMPLLG